MGFLCLYRWDGLHPYFLQQIGHGGNTGFTDGFLFVSSQTFESVRTVGESEISEQGRGTFPTWVVPYQRPLKTGVRIRNVYLFPSSYYLPLGKMIQY